MWRMILLLTLIALASACRSRGPMNSLMAEQTVPCVDHSDCICHSVRLKRAELPVRYSSTRSCPGTLHGKPSILFESFDSQGHLVDHGQYLDGLMQDEWTSYHSDGTLAARSTYVSGCEDGEALTWYEDGSLEWRSSYRVGVPSGRWEHRLKTGQIDRTLEWRDGVLATSQRLGNDGLLHDKPIKPHGPITWPCIGSGKGADTAIVDAPNNALERERRQ